MINTGNYDNCLAGNLISISGDKGHQVNFSGRSYSKLSPKLEFWKTWHENIGKIPEADNNRYYIEQYYEQVLSKLDANEVALELGENPILLCYENNNDFCHRHIVAAWLEDELGISVPEVKVDLEGNINYLTKPEYIKEQYLNIAHKEKSLIYKNDYLEMEYNNCDQEYIDDIIKTSEEEYPKIMNFFGLKKLDKKLKIKLWDSFEDFKQYRISIGFLQGDWVTGIARSVSDINEIHMLSLRESVLAPGHQNNNIQTILKEVVHEFAHICHFQYNSYTFILKWFSEGLASYLANQFTICDIDCSLEEVLNKYINFKYFYTMVSYLINNYDESYLMELAKNNELLIKDTPRIFEEAKKWSNIESTIKDEEKQIKRIT